MPQLSTKRHLSQVVRFNPGEIRKTMKEVEGFNAKLAVLITGAVGTMACAYLFAVLAFLGLKPALSPGGEGVIAWIAQTFLQLVLLSIIMVGQRVQSAASDGRAEKQFKDTVAILDALDLKTEGGLQTILNAIEKTQRAGA
jgi:hypothetical protein